MHITIVKSNHETPDCFAQSDISGEAGRSWLILCDMHSDMGGTGDCPEASWVRPCLWSFRIDVFWLVVPPEGARQVGLLPGGAALMLKMRQLGGSRPEGSIVCLGSKHLRRRHKALFLYIFGEAYRDDTIARAQRGRTFTWLISTPALENEDKAQLLAIEPPLLFRPTDWVLFCIDEDFAYCVDPFRNGTISNIARTLGSSASFRLKNLLCDAENPVQSCNGVYHTTVCVPNLADALLNDSVANPCCCASLTRDLAGFSRLLDRNGFPEGRVVVPDLLMSTQYGQQMNKKLIKRRVKVLHTLVHRILAEGVRILHLNICTSPEWTHGCVHPVLRHVFRDLLINSNHSRQKEKSRDGNSGNVLSLK